MAAFEKLMLDLSQQLHLHQVISGNDDSEMERSIFVTLRPLTNWESQRLGRFLTC